MDDLPVSVRPVIRRLRRRVLIGQFLDIWPSWAAGSFIVVGVVFLISRTFLAKLATILPWLWIIPALSVAAAVVVCMKRRYHAFEILALADSLAGGQGALLAVAETRDVSWETSPMMKSVSHMDLPKIRAWRRMWPLIPAATFMFAAVMIPQRAFGHPDNSVIANDIAAQLKATLTELKKQDAITPAEEKKFDEEIERLRKAALERIDSSSWEASDALRQKIGANLSEKNDAIKWAQESVARYAAAAQAGLPASETSTEEMAKAIEKLAQMGMLADAPPELQKLLGGKNAIAGGKVQLPSDAASLRKLSEMLSRHLDERSRGFKQLARLGREFGHFDPSEYPEFSNKEGPEGNGDPGVGGINRGRGDASMTWGRESLNFDRFKAVPLPPGAARSPDDWAPIAVLPGAPKESPELGEAAPAQTFADTAGQEAWRRTLAPRHTSAVKKYFASDSSSQRGR
jgi:hypothetical protein